MPEQFSNQVFYWWAKVNSVGDTDTSPPAYVINCYKKESLYQITICVRAMIYGANVWGIYKPMRLRAFIIYQQDLRSDNLCHLQNMSPPSAYQREGYSLCKCLMGVIKYLLNDLS